ncbi:bacteriocin [Neisseria dentiae]|nr:bacteriocin [Neisseria dentiae]QMT45345.1 bacteriocin [Neisseria dentiae]
MKELNQCELKNVVGGLVRPWLALWLAKKILGGK